MVTTGEFVRHLVTSAVVMGVGFAAVAWVCFRWDVGRRTLRRFALWYVGLLALIAVLSRLSNVSRVRCPGNPAEWCRFNDSVPAMGTIAVVFAIVGLFRARSLYVHR